MCPSLSLLKHPRSTLSLWSRTFRAALTLGLRYLLRALKVLEHHEWYNYLLGEELEADQSDFLPEGPLDEGGDSPHIEDLSAHIMQLSLIVVLVPEPANARAHEPLAEDARFKPCLFPSYSEDLTVNL